MSQLFTRAVSPLKDIDFFQHLEMHMRAELPSLAGRDHLSFRSYYVPAKVFNHCVCVLLWLLDL